MDDNIIRFPGFLITADRNGCWTEVLSGAVAKAAQARGRGWLIPRKYRFEPLPRPSQLLNPYNRQWVRW
jgi:hypothetical protein